MGRTTELLLRCLPWESLVLDTRYLDAVWRRQSCSANSASDSSLSDMSFNLCMIGIYRQSPPAHQDEDFLSRSLDTRCWLARPRCILHMIAYALCALVDLVQNLLLAASQAYAGKLLSGRQQLKQRWHACTGLQAHQRHHCVQPAQQSTFIFSLRGRGMPDDTCTVASSRSSAGMLALCCKL